MKNKISLSILSILLCMGLLLSFTGCALTAYACEVIEDGSFEVSAEKSDADDRVIQIGSSTYSVKYDSSVRSKLTNELFDVYGVVEESSNLIRSKIKINSQTGEIYSFSNITPYEKIDDIANLTDEALKVTVEQLMAELVDFSVYNTFEISRPHSSNSVYYLVWQVQQDLMCNIKLEIYISFDGAIKSYHRTDACPNNLTRSFVTTDDRNTLLQNEISEYLGVESLDGIEYEIQTETLSYYDNKEAIIYSVKILNDGFEQMISLVIS